MFFDSWTSLGRTAATGVMAYVVLVVFLRLSGKRTLSKMNAFDLVVTVALGSTLATILVSREVPLADGLVALALLIGLQYVVAWASVRSPRFENLVKSTPSLLLHRGELQEHQLRRNRVSVDEIRAAVRTAGIPDYRCAGAVVLETDGTFSVISAEHLGTDDVLRGLEPGRDPTA
jgi:uncharacterized membrane protein YcaP (DUF421 family)